MGTAAGNGWDGHRGGGGRRGMRTMKENTSRQNEKPANPRSAGHVTPADGSRMRAPRAPTLRSEVLGLPRRGV